MEMQAETGSRQGRGDHHEGRWLSAWMGVWSGAALLGKDILRAILSPLRTPSAYPTLAPYPDKIHP